MKELHWAIKSSFVAYVRGMPDGRVVLGGGAREEGGVFVFPQAGDGENRAAEATPSETFTGTVLFEGHDGLMRVEFRDPAIVEVDGRTVLTLADSAAPDARLTFATLDLGPGIHSPRPGTHVALTPDGADLFFGPYEEGTPFDDLRLLILEP
ncbi:MAG: hypothetical protein JWQ19_1189 [Subtercola sp.]|nr:hypothetical protein [Subtercola sp.]